MACDYISIPGKCLFFLYLSLFNLYPIATSVNIECVFSCGQLVLLYVHGCLAVQSTYASLCVGLWSSQDLVKNSDINKSLCAGKVVGKKDELADNWDAICMV